MEGRAPGHRWIVKPLRSQLLAVVRRFREELWLGPNLENIWILPPPAKNARAPSAPKATTCLASWIQSMRNWNSRLQDADLLNRVSSHPHHQRIGATAGFMRWPPSPTTSRSFSMKRDGGLNDHAGDD